jgi:hypothetical protein
MSKESAATRWWEYYLPRYLMPSIAGVLIVNWLCAFGGDGFRFLLSLPIDGKPMDATSLVLLLLYGNLFCYVASYPVLVFHATRVMDFSNGKWPARPLLDGYILTVVLIVCAFLFHWVPAECRYWPAFVTASIVGTVQLVRLWMVLSHPFQAKGHIDPVSSAYFYAYELAHRRVISADRDAAAPDDRKDAEPDDTRWREEIIETYRHLREHGNSAFIFLLELTLAALTYCVITKPGQSPTHQLAAIGWLFAIWAIPSVFVHLLSQHLEHRFSRYDSKLRAAIQSHQ